MFGYLKPYTPELRVKEDGFYKALYCGICRSLGRTVSQSARLTLSYDAAFLALLLAEISGEPFQVRPGRCVLHPQKKKPFVTENDAVRKASAASFVFAYYKILDDSSDEKGLRRLGAKAILPKSRRDLRRAEKMLQIDRAALRDGFAALADAERAGESADALASRTGRLTGILFSGCSADEVQKDLLFSVGEHIGRWVYFADAADDYEKDLQKKRFNPFAKDGIRREDLAAAMEIELSRTEELLRPVRYTDEGVHELLNNILFLGCQTTCRRILENPKKG